MRRTKHKAPAAAKPNRPSPPLSPCRQKTPEKTWKSSQLSRNVFRVEVPVRENQDWEFWSLLVSDQHHDNPHSNHDLELKHLKLAQERGAAVVSCGDTFCAMQGKYDKRANKASLRPEHQVDDYFDALVSTAADFYSPFAKSFVCFGVGNHESAITHKHEIRLIDRLVGALNDRTGSRIHVGGFSGFVVFSFQLPRTTTCCSVRVVLHYDHGYGGGGAVTDDMIQHHRRSVYLPDADIVISGHTHSAWTREFSRVRLTAAGTIRHDVQTHIKLPTYKEEYGDGYGGWHVETGKTPRPLGGWWLRFYYERASQRVLYEVVRAA